MLNTSSPTFVHLFKRLNEIVRAVDPLALGIASSSTTMPPSTINGTDRSDALEAIRKTFEDFEKDVNPSDRRVFSNTTLQQVRQALLDCENDLAARGKCYNMRRVESFIQSLQNYSQSIEILCNGTPYLPWIWSPITLILKVFLRIPVRDLVLIVADCF